MEFYESSLVSQIRGQLQPALVGALIGRQPWFESRRFHSRRQVQRGEQGVELAEWPSGNHSDGNVTDVQMLQGREGARGYGYQFRTGLDFCQRTVDVEEKSAAPDL